MVKKTVMPDSEMVESEALLEASGDEIKIIPKARKMAVKATKEKDGVTPLDAIQAPPAPIEKPTKRSSKKATETKANIFEDDTEDYRLDALTSEQDEKQRWANILKYKRRGVVLERPITNIDPPPSGSASVRIVVYVEGFKVIIHKDDFFGEGIFGPDIDTVSAEERTRREMQVATKMIGANVSFVINNAEMVRDGANIGYVVTASRLEALERKKAKYFFAKSGEPVKAGDIIKVRVLLTNNKRVRVEALGVETDIPVSELSSCRWVNPITDYPSGTVMYVVVENVEVDRATKFVSLVLTRKPLDANKMYANIKNCVVGARYGGTVVGVTDKAYFINLDGVEVRGIVLKSNYIGNRLVYNDKVSFQITRIDEEKGRVLGRCMYLPHRQF